MLHLPGLTFDHGEDIAALRETIQQFAAAEEERQIAAQTKIAAALEAERERLVTAFRKGWIDEAEADERQIALSLDDAREVVYGMPYAEWKAQYQQEASPEQQAAFAKGKPND